MQLDLTIWTRAGPTPRLRHRLQASGWVRPTRDDCMVLKRATIKLRKHPQLASTAGKHRPTDQGVPRLRLGRMQQTACRHQEVPSITGVAQLGHSARRNTPCLFRQRRHICHHLQWLQHLSSTLSATSVEIMMAIKLIGMECACGLVCKSFCDAVVGMLDCLDGGAGLPLLGFV